MSARAGGARAFVRSRASVGVLLAAAVALAGCLHNETRIERTQRVVVESSPPGGAVFLVDSSGRERKGEERLRLPVGGSTFFLSDGIAVVVGSQVLAAFELSSGVPLWALDVTAIAGRLGITPIPGVQIGPAAVPLRNGTVRVLFSGEPPWALDVALETGELLRHHALGGGRTHGLVGDGEGTLHRQGEELVRLGPEGAELFRAPVVPDAFGPWYFDTVLAVGDGVVQLRDSNRLLRTTDGSVLVPRTVTNSYGQAGDLSCVVLPCAGSALTGGGVVRLLDVVGLGVHTYDAASGAELGVVPLDEVPPTDDRMISCPVLTSELGFAALHEHSANLVALSGPPYRAVLLVAPLQGRSRRYCLPQPAGRRYGGVLTLAPGLALVTTRSVVPREPFLLHALELPLAPAAEGWVASDGDGAGGRRPRLPP